MNRSYTVGSASPLFVKPQVAAWHTHTEEGQLVFGCAACIERVKAERWASAPECTVHCRATVPAYVVRHADGRAITWDYTVRARVPLDVTPTELEEHALGDDECGVGMPEFPGLTDQQRSDALITAIVRVLRVERDPAPTLEQPPLFGGAA